MNSSPIDPINIPHFTGDVDALAGDIANLAKDASDIRTTGADTHASFQGLSAYYAAPEAAQLFSSTLPVRERAAHFADELNKVKAALSEYAAEIRPIVKELDRLREQAVAFRAAIGSDDKWLKDQSKVDENTHLIQAVAVAQEKFHAAELNAFNKITGLFDKSLRLVQDDGTHKKGMYGYDPSDAAKAQKTPWGNVEKREYEGVEAVWHWTADKATSIAKGFFIDGTWAQIRGLGTLVGFDGAEKSKEALKNMALLAFVSNYAPVAEVARYLPDSWLPKVGREYKAAANNASKGLVAWDEWGKNPARAFGTTTFNGLTLLAGPGKFVAGTKTGMLAKTASTVAKVGEAIDPATYAAKGAKLGLKATTPVLLKVGDLASELRQLTGKLPDHAPTPSAASFKYTAADGKALLLDSKGNLRSPETIEHPLAAEARQEPHNRDLTGAHEASPTDHRVLIHSGGSNTAGHGLPMHGSHNESASPGSHAAHESTPDRSGAQGGHSEVTGSPGNEHTSAGHSPGADDMHGSHGEGNHGLDAHSVGDPADPPVKSADGRDHEAPPQRKGVWPARHDIPGPAAGEELKRPNPRHTPNGAAGREIKPKNSVILRGYLGKVDRDIEAIADGRAKLTEDGNRYEIDGRTYGVEDGGRVYPVSGPGIVILDRNEYAALQQIAKAKGDINSAPQLTRNPRFVNNPEAVQKALDIYNGTYR
ncbi:hypothetical protein [Streptomyces hesseae]|uniref:Protein phosphatase n=1 Tax=Streptomyces hesseae TaxID=3075519 RepID=A0ABU2SU54_9ACTN|nr:hypothetical protein [Streptomyces sp. DSM 40473]MDT0452392.1 hypothetical protein [Streptomyces sp. DSM 40473]